MVKSQTFVHHKETSLRWPFTARGSKDQEKNMHKGAFNSYMAEHAQPNPQTSRLSFSLLIIVIDCIVIEDYL